MVPSFAGLEPPDFYLWGYLKDRVYSENPQTIPELKAAITAAERGISREECGRVIENLTDTVYKCASSGGLPISNTFCKCLPNTEF